MSEEKKFRWMSVPGVLILMVGCSIIGGDSDDDDESPTVAQLVVYAELLNVRDNPSGSANVIARAKRGTLIVPTHKSGVWYGVEMSDGSTGWVHSDYLVLAD